MIEKNDDSLDAICSRAIACLHQAFDLPPERLKSKVDQAENLVVKLRNAMIDRLRAEQDGGRSLRPSRWRAPLDQVNMCLSLIAGVAYPGSKIHHNYVEDACRVLLEVRKEIEQTEGMKVRK